MSRTTRAIPRSAAVLGVALALAGCTSRSVVIGLSGPAGAAAVLPPPAQTIAERSGGLLPHERFEYGRNDPRFADPGSLPDTAHWPGPVRPWERPVRFRRWEQR
ncbi:MAG: hypothetical protein KDA21_08180 [Phycisphaerales bacterium]|nr:hypothetical protein [Phycisphaerales bacterium]